jgi:hypothetical protein
MPAHALAELGGRAPVEPTAARERSLAELPPPPLDPLEQHAPIGFPARPVALDAARE